MNVLISTNNNYTYPTRVMLTSLFENNKTDIRCFLLYNDLNEDSKRLISKTVSEYSKASIEFVYIESELFSEMPLEAESNPYITIETYFRLAINEKLPQEIERVLYLDTDIIINKSIQDFYNTYIETDKIVVACEDKGLLLNKKFKERVWKNLEFEEDDRYFNAGVILIDMKKFREKYSLNFFRNFVRENHNKLVFHDQDVLNAMLKNHVQYADADLYDFRPFCYPFTKKTDEFMEKEAVIIHYGEKPWVETFSDMGRSIFAKYAQKIDSGVQWKEIEQINDKYRIKNRGNMLKKKLKRNLRILVNRFL